MFKVVQLPLRFDVQGLRADLEAIPPEQWQRHFNTAVYEGEWSGVALRAAAEGLRSIYPDPSADARYADTSVLRDSPNLGAALAQFRCDLLSVRLLRLSAGSVIKEHRDYKLAHGDGEVRLHVPIVTSPQVEFVLDGERIFMPEGTCWYCDFTLPHRISNRSNVDRVHLVIDCVVNEWLTALLTGSCAA